MQATYSAAGVDTAQEKVGLAQLLIYVKRESSGEAEVSVHRSWI